MASISAARVTRRRSTSPGSASPGAGPDPAPSTASSSSATSAWAVGWQPSRCSVDVSAAAVVSWPASRNTSAWSRTSCGVRPSAPSGSAAWCSRPTRSSRPWSRPLRAEVGQHLLHHLLQLAVQPLGPAVAQRGPPHRHLDHLQAAPADRVADLWHQRVEHGYQALDVVPEQGAADDPQRVAHREQVQVHRGRLRRRDRRPQPGCRRPGRPPAASGARSGRPAAQ